MKDIKFMQGDVRDKIKELENHSIDCVVTSPPYWGLRDYGVKGQLGLEPTYQEHIKNIVNIFQLLKPKLKDSATIWLNYGDCYATAKNGRMQVILLVMTGLLEINLLLLFKVN